MATTTSVVGGSERHVMGYWDFFWLMIWAFFFIAYLVVLFQVITDIFADKSLNGWAKAVWVVALVVIPWLTALVYLIVRGKGMTERQSAAAAAQKRAADDYIRSVASGPSAAEQIAQAKTLLDSGALSQTEFDQLKAKALS